MTPRERLLLYSLGLKQAPGAVFVEVGSYLGASSCFLAAAALEVGGARLHCVDTWRNEGMTEGPRDTWAQFLANTEPVSSAIVAHRGRSADVAAAFDEEVDLLFVNGDHSYEGCRADVLAWLPRVKSGGIVVMHDFGWAEGVRRVVQELVEPSQVGPGRVVQNTFWTKVDHRASVAAASRLDAESRSEVAVDPRPVPCCGRAADGDRVERPFGCGCCGRHAWAGGFRGSL